MAPEARSASGELTHLRAAVRDDRAAMSRCVADARLVVERWAGDAPERPYLFMAAVAIHGWYTGLEGALERIERALDGSLPEGDTWHRELVVRAMTEVPGVRPAVFPRSLAPHLRALLGFRHFFRHAYGVELDPPRLRTELDRLLLAAPDIDLALDDFDAFLCGAIQNLADAG